MDNCLKVGDWVIVDGGNCGMVSYIHNPTLIDVFFKDTQENFIIRTDHYKITKISKEVADIMRGV